MCEYFEASTNTRIVVMIPERMKEKDLDFQNPVLPAEFSIQII